MSSLLLPDSIEGICTCQCHEKKGPKIYHVIWKPCCERPIQGGKEMPIWEVPKENPQARVIASSYDEAKKSYDEIFVG